MLVIAAALSLLFSLVSFVQPVGATNSPGDDAECITPATEGQEPCDEEETGNPDVVVVKSAEVTSIEIGESYDYVLTVTNNGDATAKGVVLEDNLDNELTIDGISPEDACSFTADNNHIRCELDDLGEGESAVVTVTVTATIGAPGNPICRSPVDNWAEVSADNESGEAANNNESSVVVVEIDCSGVGSLKILKEDDEGNPLSGAIFTVEGQPSPFTTGADGTFCVLGLPFGEVLTVTETQAPEGYEIVGSGTQEVTVDPDGDCDSVEATFVNTPAGEEEEEEQGGGTLPGNPTTPNPTTPNPTTPNPTTPRGGTAGGNPPLPNTAMLSELNGSVPAALLALLMLAGLGAGAWVTAAEVRRRR